MTCVPTGRGAAVTLWTGARQGAKPRRPFRPAGPLCFARGLSSIALTLAALLVGTLQGMAFGIPGLEIHLDGSGHLRLSLSNQVFGPVLVESSADLIHWDYLLSTSNRLEQIDLNPSTNDHLFYRVLPNVHEQTKHPFSVTLNGTTATVGPGNLVWADGSTSHFPGGTVRLMTDATNYLVVNFGSLRLHNLRRWIGDGELLVAAVVTHFNSTNEVQVPISFAVPPTRLGSVKAKLATGTSPLRVATLGDSLTEISPPVNWRALLFDSSLSIFGYHVTSRFDPIVYNLGVSSSASDYGLALVSKAAQSCGTVHQGGGFAGVASDFGIRNPETLPQPTFPLTSASQLWRFKPDLVTVGFGVNAGPYSLNNLESIGRALIQDHQVPTLFLTENDYRFAPTSDSILTALLGIREKIGGSIADTAAYVEEVNRNGTNTYVDVIHQNDQGWMAWAEAIQGVLASHPQAEISVPISNNRVTAASPSADEPYLELGGTMVGGIPLEVSSGARLTKTSLYYYPGYLPSAFQDSVIVEVPGRSGVSTNYVTYCHHCWNWASLLIERGVGVPGSASNGFHGYGTNSFAGYCSWLDHEGREHLISHFSFRDDQAFLPRPGTVPIALISQVLPAITNQISSGITGGVSAVRWTSSALRISITEGNARIIGVLFGGPRHEELDLTPTSAVFDQPNPWKMESPESGYGLTRGLYSDWVGAQLGITVRAHGIQLLFGSGSNGGILRMQGDGGEPTDLNLFSLEPSSRMVSWFAGDTSSDGIHHLNLQLLPTMTSQGTSNTGNHGCTLLKATLIR